MKQATKTFDYVDADKTFRETFQQLRLALPNGIVRVAIRNVTPVSRFEAVAVGAALALKTRKKLVASGAPKWLGSKELMKLNTAAANNRPMLLGRIEYAREKFLGK